MAAKKRTTSTRVPSYRLHRGSGQAVVTIKDASGKPRDVYLGKFDSPESQVAYQRTIAEWRSGRVYVKPESPPDLTVAELCVSFKEWADGYYRKNGKPTSQVLNCTRAIRCLCECFPDLAAREFDSLKLMACQRKLIADGLCRGSVNRYSAIIIAIFKHGIKHKLIPSAYIENNVATAIISSLETVGTLPKGRTEARETDPVEPVSDADLEATIPHLDEPFASMVRAQLLLACRPGELVDMSLDQIDRSGAIWLYRPRSFKTMHHEGKTRIIPVGPRCQAVLKPFLTFEGVPLFRNARGQKVSARCYAAAITRACRRAGIEPWSPNQLRHAGASNIRKLHNLEAAQIILGHSSMNTTEIYAERNIAAAVKIAAEVG